MHKVLPIIITTFIIAGGVVALMFAKNQASAPVVTNFEECVAAGNPVMESYPRRCRNGFKTFIEDISKACTQEAKLCPDGSAVGRTGPNCEFAQCPLSETSCIKDSDCLSLQYTCEESQGTGTACPSADTSCIPTHTTIAGECKLKKGNRCTVDSNCVSGNVCNNNVCTSPIGKQCNGPSDRSCPTNFECIQACGPPVSRENDPPTPYFCQLKGYIRTCPICLAKNTLIDTPLGKIAVQDLQKGAPIWTIDNSDKRVVGVIVKVSKTEVPSNHKMVKLILDDGRTLLVSPGHPTINGQTVGDLVLGEVYDGARVVSVGRVLYRDGFTYDILPALSGVEGPSGGTGFYFANAPPEQQESSSRAGILLESTLGLKRQR